MASWLLHLAHREEREVRGRAREEERVEAIEHAAVAEEEPPGVFDAEVALDRRLEEIAHERRENDDPAEDEGLPALLEEPLVEPEPRGQDAREGARDETLPGLPRGHHRRHLVAPREPPGDVRERVRDEDGQEDGEDE